MSRFESAPEPEHRFLRELLHMLYVGSPPSRPLLRALMGRFLGIFSRQWKKDMAIAPVLEVRPSGGPGGRTGRGEERPCREGQAAGMGNQCA